jgi:general nucleoside transport system ATP-binding protein
MNPPAAGVPLLEARGIVKRFGPLLANDVDAFAVHPGEVVALLGENGAGKSTLCKILYGYYQPDAGEIRVAGEPASIASPRDARRLGIGMVFQNFSLIPEMTVWENVALFLDGLPMVLGPEKLRQRMRRHAERLRFTVDPRLPAGRLAVGDRQKVEILKQLLAGARVLILDEPTKVLAPQEVDGLFHTLTELRDDGYGIVFITHKLREVTACADRVAVMRQGRIVGHLAHRDASEATLLGLMFGGAAPALTTPPRGIVTGATVLELEGITTPPMSGAAALSDVTIRMRAGEILGVAGVSGNGQRELAELILGLRRPSRGTRRLWGEPATTWSAARTRASGVASIPDDPLALAAIPSLTVRENLVLGSGRRYAVGLGFDWPLLAADMDASSARLRFPPPPYDARAAVLSGGNLQRAVLTRELACDPKLIVALYPTRGLDARGAEALRSLLGQARANGAAILLVSEDLDELFAVSDSLIVLRDGRVAGTFQPDQFRAELVGPCMVGPAVAEATDAA